MFASVGVCVCKHISSCEGVHDVCEQACACEQLISGFLIETQNWLTGLVSLPGDLVSNLPRLELQVATTPAQHL